MSGNENAPDTLYLLDANTISEAFRAFNPDIFVSFWELFDALVRNGRAESVRLVRLELENASRPVVAKAPAHLVSLNRNFFSDPTEQEQGLVREMTNNPALSAAASRWRKKGELGTEDADPYLVARSRVSMLPITVVSQESQADIRTGTIPAVCRYYGLRYANLDGMITELGWRF